MIRLSSFAILFACVCLAGLPIAAAQEDPAVPEGRIETWTGKTVLVFTPHPDDDTFLCGGIMSILAANGNKVIVVIYTNDNKGSLDLDMTRERLARIRRAEEEKACEILGIPKENIIWLGYEDGDLEYANPRVLRGEACRLMKKYQPDAVFTIDPGTTHERWHKTDHRMAAFITKDAFIASEWHLYYPQHLLDEGLKPYHVPLAFYYYTEEPNYTVDITEIAETKVKASAAHVSQFEPSLSKYTPDMADETFEGIRQWALGLMKDGERYVERFRREEWP
ncbi:MAG: PIG-L family deacetylase [Candidatus Hydrogenedentes bacterium]|nr:PIG-L family deacetylase [Candidatus Hydrogenedentota bacterium]